MDVDGFMRVFKPQTMYSTHIVTVVVEGVRVATLHSGPLMLDKMW